MSKRGRWLSNTHDPADPDADTFVHKLDCESQEQAVSGWRAWLAQGEIGPPKATHTYTVEELQEKGLVGVYAKTPQAD
jgi:hypothetical protein